MQKKSELAINHLLTLVIAFSAAAFGAYFGIYISNQNIENQDTETAIRLLHKTSEVVADQAVSLENMVTDPNLKLDNMSSYEDFINLRDSLNQFEYSGIEVPYPIIFDKIVDEDKVYSRLSSTGIHSIYRIQESLRKEKSYIVGTSNETQEFLIANDDYLISILKDSDEVAKFVDSYVRVSNLKQYKKHLEVLSSILNIQAEYIQGNINENEANTRTSDVEIKAFKPQSTLLEQEDRLKQMEQLKELIIQLKLENTTTDSTQDTAPK